jgi:O-methyltransferase
LEQELTTIEGTREAYLDLLERSLTHSIYAGSDSVPFPSRNPLKRWLTDRMRRRGMTLVRSVPDAERRREEGLDWPLFGQTMVGRKRLRNLRESIETALAEEVPGDVIETGVWRGGASIFAKGVLRAHGADGDRVVWVADSFQGLPPPDADSYPADAGGKWHTADYLAVSREEVEENFRRYGLLDDNVRFLEGWFRDTLPTVRDRTWAVVRLDGDMYESTMDGLRNLYPGLSPGGFLIVDDYSIDVCKQAVHDFRDAEGITEPIEEIDLTGVFWRKPG